MHGTVDLPDNMPAFIRALPRNHADMPVPLGFSMQDQRLFERAGWAVHCCNNNKCWACGRQLDRYSAFILSPAALVASVSVDPPMHEECATFVLDHCAWTSGAVALWVGQSHKAVFVTSRKMIGTLLGRPRTIAWYNNGARATAEDVRAEIEAEVTALRRAFEKASPKAQHDIQRRVVYVRRLLNR